MNDPDIHADKVTPSSSLEDVLPGSSQPGHKFKLPFVVNTWLSAYYACLVVVVVVVAIVAVSSAHSSFSPKVALVDINSKQFSPATIQVKPGTEVTWTNDDTKAHQVAADPFPKDTGIPGFDNSVLLQANDSVSYTFTKAGTYTYHDEKNPFQLQGTVVVK